MTKADKRQIDNLKHIHSNLHIAGISRDTFAGIAARTVSFMIRASMTSKKTRELLQIAADLGITNHPDFII